MGFGDFIKGQFVDVIEFVDHFKAKSLVQKFVRQGDEIKQGAQLIVRNGQQAVFVYRGEIADIFKPGNYKLDTGNLPILSSLAAIPHWLNSPIKSDLYFVNTTQFINNHWQTKNPIIKRDSELGIVRITATGTFSFRVKDTRVFMTEVFGARNLNITSDIVEYLISFVGEAIAQCLGELDASVLDLATHYGELSSMVTAYVDVKAADLGFEIPQASIENISLPESVEKLIDEQSGVGLASRNMDDFVQYQSARAIRDAASQPGGMAGLGASMAVGRKVADSMDFSLNSKGKVDKGNAHKPSDSRNGQDSPSGDKTSSGTDVNDKTANNKIANDESVGGKAEKDVSGNGKNNVQSVADQLNTYKDLLDRGILTKDEYDELKSMLLSKL